MPTHRTSGSLVVLQKLAVALLVGGTVIPATALAQTASSTAITFTKDVAPILQRSCQNCHRPGSIGPMSLLTYEEARPWVRSIRSKVASRAMPPWHVDKTVGIQKFKGDISLTDQEIATILSWADGGAPRGNPADMPPPKHFDDGDAWQFGEPDLIVELPVEYVVKAQGPDAWREFVVPLGLTENRYYRAVQTIPGARSAVHHMSSVIVQSLTPEEVLPGMEDNLEGGSTIADLKSGVPVEMYLSSYEVGKNADAMPEGTGRLLKAGSFVKIEVHYSSVGKEIRDRSRIGIWLYPKGYEPKYHQITKGIGNARNSLDIPAGATVRVDGYQLLNRPARISAVQPHMHQRGKRMCVEAILPSGSIEQMNCFDFNFNWQKLYVYEDAAAPLLPAGTLVHVVGWYDNSSANRDNPDPRNWVGSGSRSNDEMFFARTTWTYLEEADFKRMVAEREAAAKTKTGN
jgi:hypothetical protein